MRKKIWLITGIAGMLLCMPQFTAQAHYGDGFRHRHDRGEYRRYEHRHDRGEYRRDFYDREERRRRWREEERRRRHDFERRHEHRHDRRY
jgi:hypothetical protein